MSLVITISLTGWALSSALRTSLPRSCAHPWNQGNLSSSRDIINNPFLLLLNNSFHFILKMKNNENYYKRRKIRIVNAFPNERNVWWWPYGQSLRTSVRFHQTMVSFIRKWPVEELKKEKKNGLIECLKGIFLKKTCSITFFFLS